MISRRRRRRQKALKSLLIILGALAVIFIGLIVFKLIQGGGINAPVLSGDTPATAAPESPTPPPMPTPSPSPTAAPTPSPTPLPLIPMPSTAAQQEADYAFYWFTDTQHYSERYPETFRGMTRWMRDNIDTYNVKYAFFTGDFVNVRGAPEQWAVADEAMRMLDGKLPVFAIAGNHDVGTSSSNYRTYLDYFGPERFPDNPGVTREWFDGGKGRCDAVTIDGTKYLFVGLGYGVGNSGVSWVNKKLAQYPDHNAVLLFHDYMNTDGLLSDRGEELYKKIVVPNKNVFLVLCGHRYNCSLLITDINDDGTYLNKRTVYNVMMNYQAFENGGNGFLTLIRVYKKDKLITLDSYSPTLKSWYRFNPDRYLSKDKLALPVRIFD